MVALYCFRPLFTTRQHSVGIHTSPVARMHALNHLALTPTDPASVLSCVRTMIALHIALDLYTYTPLHAHYLTSSLPRSTLCPSPPFCRRIKTNVSPLFPLYFSRTTQYNTAHTLLVLSSPSRLLLLQKKPPLIRMGYVVGWFRFFYMWV